MARPFGAGSYARRRGREIGFGRWIEELSTGGTIHGSIRAFPASERVELKSSARVTGDIDAPVIVMEAGAVHDGQCQMTKEKAAEPSLSLVIPFKG